MDEKQMAKADFITSIVMIFAGIVILGVGTLYFPRFSEWGGIYSNPGFTPFLMVLALVGMYLYLLVRSLKRGGNQIRLTGEKSGNSFNPWWRNGILIRSRCSSCTTSSWVLIPFICLHLPLPFPFHPYFGGGPWGEGSGDFRGHLHLPSFDFPADFPVPLP